MIGHDTRFQNVALGMSRDCGIPEPDISDVAARVLHRAMRRPAGARYASALHTLREELARRLGVPRRRLPKDWPALKAVGQYAAEERRYGGWLSRSWPRAFEHHSRRFAIENQVCPRCTRRGPFTESAGRCECGYGY